VVEAINLQPEVDLLYSDEDKIDESGRRYDPFFKPDWSPDLLLSENYICHLLVIRRSRLNQAGGFRSAFDGSQDYDLVLRLTGGNPRIVHIPRVLYHWRSLPESTATSPDRKSFAIPAAQRAIQEELDRRGVAAKVVPGSIPGRWRVRYLLAEEPRVSVIIPSGGKTDPLRDNLTSLFGKTEYHNYEVVVIDNSANTDIQKLVERWPDPPRPLRYIDWRNRPFNYSVINNEAARHCQSPLLLFLNDDTSVIDPGWLQALVEMAARPEVGAVGAKLLYPNGKIQHGGVVMGLFNNCGHAFKGLAGAEQHYFDLPDVIRNVSAVTGACLMTRAEVFHAVGGFDERTFAVAFNDIDLCLKIGQKGYRVIYTPHALLHHHEAFSKLVEDLMPHPDEVEAMRVKWKDAIEADPFYSPNLTRTAEDYSLQKKAP
jgi:O-antigen biosynthesis protein